MFSIIVCSIRPEQAAVLERNIASTIGVPFEFIAFDNRGTGKGICAVYNECAERAKYDMLCFLHEDVAFHTQNWGKILAAKLSENDCGVIGFAGATAKYPYAYGWQSLRSFTRKNYLRGSLDGGRKSLRRSGGRADFDRVVTLDGMALCVRREVWAGCRFDAEMLDGFHSYDTDFTTALFSKGYINYVCKSVLLEHFSVGSFSRGWYESVLLYLQKWQGVLPLYVGSEHGVKEIQRKAADVEGFALLQLLKNRILSSDEANSRVREFCHKHPLSLRSLKLKLKLRKYRE